MNEREKLIKEAERCLKYVQPGNAAIVMQSLIAALRQSEPVNTKDRDEGFRDTYMPSPYDHKVADAVFGDDDLHGLPHNQMFRHTVEVLRRKRETWNAAYDFALRRTEKEQAVLDCAQEFAKTVHEDPYEPLIVLGMKLLNTAISAYPPVPEGEKTC